MDHKSHFRRTLADPPGSAPSFQTRSSATDSLDLSVACFYLICSSRVQCWESQKSLIDWCLTGVTSKCRQTISLTWDGQENMAKVHTETFLSPSVCCSCKMLLLSLPFHKQSKGTRHCCQHSIEKIKTLYINSECAEDQHFCHLSEKCFSEKDPDSVCSFLLFEEGCFGMCCAFISASSWTMGPGDLKIVSSPSYYFCVAFL